MDLIRKNIFWIVLALILIFNIYLYFTTVSDVRRAYSAEKENAKRNKNYLERLLSPAGAGEIPYIKSRIGYVQGIKAISEKINTMGEYFYGRYDEKGNQIFAGINDDTGGYHNDTTDKDLPFGTFYLKPECTDKNRIEPSIRQNIGEYYIELKKKLEKEAEESNIKLGVDEKARDYGLLDASLGMGSIDVKADYVRDTVRKFYIFREVFRAARNAFAVTYLPHIKLGEDDKIENLSKEAGFKPPAMGGPRVYFRDTETGEVIHGQLFHGKREGEMKEVMNAYKRMGLPVILGVVPKDKDMLVRDPRDPQKTYKVGELDAYPDIKKAIVPSFQIKRVIFDKFDDQTPLYKKYRIILNVAAYSSVIDQFLLNLMKQEQLVMPLKDLERRERMNSEGVDTARRIFFVLDKLELKRETDFQTYPYSVGNKSNSIFVKDPNKIDWTEYFQPDPPIQAVITLYVIYGKDEIKTEIPEIVKNADTGSAPGETK